MTAGSRGDVAPYTGLGYGLSRAGHEVTLVTHGRFAGLVEGSGVGFHPLPVDPRTELESARGRGLHRSASGVGKLLRVVEMARRLVGRMTDDLLAAAQASDVLLLSGSLAPIGPRQRSGAARRARERRLWPVQHGFSPQVVPRPRDWRPGLGVCGYWWPYDGEARLPDAVRAFLDAGPPPVFVGLGSATVPDADRLSRQVVAALRKAGLRGVIQSGWGGLTADGDDMLTIGEMPHSVLFPRMAAVVHHAGAGTTAAGLRAGVPAVPLPIQFDEGFWAARLVRLGVAPAAVPLRGLSVNALAGALRQATRDPGFTERAKELGERIRAEDGVAPVTESLGELAT
jgi:sterol 3beta-glucosyltransferase